MLYILAFLLVVTFVTWIVYLVCMIIYGRMRRNRIDCLMEECAWRRSAKRLQRIISTLER